MEHNKREFWESAGTASDFNAEWKEKVFGHIAKILERNGLSVGRNILDLGSGIHPVSRFIAPKDAHAVYIDFNEPDWQERIENSLHIDRDINELVDPDSFASRRTQVEASKLMGVDPHKDSPEQIDTAIISDILNYVPASDVLKRVYTHVKDGGLVIVLNQPGRTFDHAQHVLHPQGISSNEELAHILVQKLHAEPIYETTSKEGYFIGVFQIAH